MAFANIVPYGVGPIRPYPNTNGDDYAMGSAPTAGDDLYVIFIPKHYQHQGADIIATLTSTPALTFVRQDGSYDPGLSGLAQFECFRATNINPGSTPTLHFTTVDADSSSHVSALAFYVSGAASTALVCAQLHSALGVAAIPTGTLTPTQAAGMLFAVCGIRGGSGTFGYGTVPGYTLVASDGDASGNAPTMGVFAKANAATTPQSVTFNLTNAGGSSSQAAPAGAIGVLIYAEAKTLAGPAPTVTPGDTTAVGDTVTVAFTVSSTPGSPTATATLTSGSLILGPVSASMSGSDGTATFTDVPPGRWTPHVVATDANGSSLATAGAAITVIGVSSTQELHASYQPQNIIATPASVSLAVGATATLTFTDENGIELDAMPITSLNAAVAFLPAGQTDYLGKADVSGLLEGQTSVRVTWTNPSSGNSLTLTVPVQVTPASPTALPPKILSTSLPVATAGVAYSAQLAFDNGGASITAATITVPGLSLSTTGVITGIAPAAGDYTAGGSMSNSAGTTPFSLPLKVVAAPVVGAVDSVITVGGAIVRVSANNAYQMVVVQALDSAEKPVPGATLAPSASAGIILHTPSAVTDATGLAVFLIQGTAAGSSNLDFS